MEGHEAKSWAKGDFLSEGFCESQLNDILRQALLNNGSRYFINGIENFRGLCKVRLTRCRGIHKHKFYLHLKECEFRFNRRHEDIYKYLLNLI